MSEYTITKLNLKKDQKVKKGGEGSNHVGINYETKLNQRKEEN